MTEVKLKLLTHNISVLVGFEQLGELFPAAVAVMLVRLDLLGMLSNFFAFRFFFFFLKETSSASRSRRENAASVSLTRNGAFKSR